MCCATKRIVEIACPPSCVYLATAQRHPAAAVRRRQEQDLAVLLGALGRLTEPQLEIFFVLQTLIARFVPQGAPLADLDVAEAAGALAAGYETASRGVLYEPAAATPGGEALRRHLRATLTDMGNRHGRRFEEDLVPVLRGIERGARHQAPGIGDGAVDYLTLVARILHERPPQEPRSGTGLILP